MNTAAHKEGSRKDRSLQNPKFNLKDKVFAVDETGQLYAAVIERSAFHSAGSGYYWEHLVHFIGWNNRYNKWIHEDEIQPNNDASREVARSLCIEREKKDLKAKIDRQKKEKKGDKLKLDTNESISRRYIMQMEQCCALPFTLKLVLLNDRIKLMNLNHVHCDANEYCENSHSFPEKNWTLSRKLHSLPTDLSVEKILNRFAQTKEEKLKKYKVAMEKCVQEFNCGVEQSKHTATKLHEHESNEQVLEVYSTFGKVMSDLFDAMISKYLLHDQERIQYQRYFRMTTFDGKNCHDRPSQVYGGEFLLRMLAKMPVIISAFQYINTDICLSRSVDTLFQSQENNNASNLFWTCVSDLIIYLQENKSTIFRPKYKNFKTK